jgi:hypothetical protein
MLKESEGEIKTIENLAASATRPSDRQDVAIRLHHVHMPLLAEANLIEFDPTSGRIEYIGNEVVETLLESFETRRSEETDE